MRFLFKLATGKIGPLPRLNDFHVFPHDSIRKTFTFMHNPVFEESDVLSFVLLACIILYTNGKQFKCSVFTFVQYRFIICANLVGLTSPMLHTKSQSQWPFGSREDI